MQPGGGGSARMGASAHVWCGGLYWRVVVLAVCRQPNRRCGRGGAGSRTATESDGALSQWYVRLGLVLRPLLVRAWAALRVACGAGVPRLQPGGGGSRLRSLVRAPVVCLGVGFSRRTLYNISAVRGAVALLLSLRNTLTLRRSCLHSQHRIEVPSLVPRGLIRTAPASHCPIGHMHTCARTLTCTQ